MEIYSVPIDWTDTDENLSTTGIVLVGDGAVGAPSLGFASDTDTGFYLDSGPVICATIAGTKMFAVESNQLALKDSLSANMGLIVFGGKAMTGGRTFTFNLDDGTRTLKLSANLTVETACNIGGDLSPDGNWQTSGSITGTTLIFDFVTQDYLLTNITDNSLVIQSQNSASISSVNIMTKDGDGTDYVYFNLWGRGLPGQLTNTEKLSIFYAPGPTVSIATTKAGTGTLAPLSIYTGTNTTQLVLNTDNSIDMSGALGVTGNITGAYIIGSRFQGAGDADTYMLMTADQFQMWAGGVQVASWIEGFGAIMKVNPDGGNVDFWVEGQNVSKLIFVDASADSIRLGTGGGANYIGISSTGDQTFAGTAGFYPRRISQNAEPANGTGADQIDAGEMLIWHDADGAATWLMYNDATGGVVGIRLE